MSCIQNRADCAFLRVSHKMQFVCFTCLWGSLHPFQLAVVLWSRRADWWVGNGQDPIRKEIRKNNPHSLPEAHPRVKNMNRELIVVCWCQPWCQASEQSCLNLPSFLHSFLPPFLPSFHVMYWINYRPIRIRSYLFACALSHSLSLCSVCFSCGRWRSTTQPLSSCSEATTSAGISQSTSPSNRSVSECTTHKGFCVRDSTHTAHFNRNTCTPVFKGVWRQHSYWSRLFFFNCAFSGSFFVRH